jgi:hypothetical protein
MDYLDTIRVGAIRCVSALHHCYRRCVACMDAYRYLAVNEYTIVLGIILASVVCAAKPLLIPFFMLLMAALL